MKIIDKANDKNYRNKVCFECGNKDIEEPNFNTHIYDWRCTHCSTYQLKWLKNHGFRYYAFLLSGSWTSKYIIARSLKEAHGRAQKMYEGKHEILGSYLRGGVDRYSLDGWFSFKS